MQQNLLVPDIVDAEIEEIQAPAIEQTKAQVSLFSDINLYESYFKMAENLAKSELVPANYRNKPENCLLALDIARQTGNKSPFFVMQNLFLIKGKPAWSGQYCAAVVKANYKKVHEEWKKKDDPEGIGCRIVATDPQTGFECLGTWVTMKMAQQEGWINKEGSKWKTMPVLMLQYRAYSFFARVHCPDKLLGLHDEYENSDISKPVHNKQAKELEGMLKRE